MGFGDEPMIAFEKKRSKDQKIKDVNACIIIFDFCYFLQSSWRIRPCPTLCAARLAISKLNGESAFACTAGFIVFARRARR